MGAAPSARPRKLTRSSPDRRASPCTTNALFAAIMDHASSDEGVSVYKQLAATDSAFQKADQELAKDRANECQMMQT